MYQITEERIKKFEEALFLEEKAKATIQKYVSGVKRFGEYLGKREISKERVLEYREHLQKSLKAQSVNGELSAIHAFLDYFGWQECKIKMLKVQRKAFLEEEKELTKAEYERLLETAKRKGAEHLYLVMMTIGATGIRVSELKYITIEAVQKGRAEIQMKGKNRMILLQKKLRKQLIKYAQKKKIKQGVLFCTRNGNPLDRSNICHEMKKLCKNANVDACKVFPHNFRHLFARTFYTLEKNLAHLADILGHSRIETTRIYVAVSSTAHEKMLDKMDLVI